MSSEAPPHAGEHIEVDRMLDLVHGLLVPADARAAVAHITTCPDCERLLREQTGTRERARAVVAGTDRPLAWPAPRPGLIMRSPPGVRVAAPPAPRAVNAVGRRERAVAWGVVLAAAACVTVALLLPAEFGARTAPARPWLPDPGDPVVLRGDMPVNAALRDGLLAYAARDLPTAERLLEAGATAGPGDQMRRVYLADVLLRSGRPDEALQHLRSVRLVDLPEPWCSEARWMMVLALQATGDAARADSLLRALAAMPSDVGARARSIAFPIR